MVEQISHEKLNTTKTKRPSQKTHTHTHKIPVHNLPVGPPPTIRKFNNFFFSSGVVVGMPLDAGVFLLLVDGCPSSSEELEKAMIAARRLRRKDPFDAIAAKQLFRGKIGIRPE